jgi:hypothetical protein
LKLLQHLSDNTQANFNQPDLFVYEWPWEAVLQVALRGYRRLDDLKEEIRAHLNKMAPEARPLNPSS